MRLAEKYRPSVLDDVVGQDKAVGLVRGMLNRGGAGGRAFWLSGPSGAGKTTMARILAAEVADPFFVREYHSADELTSSELDEIERTSRMTAWGKGGRAFIVNEAHGLRQTTIRRLLGILEPGNVPSRVVWAFTTTWEGEQAVMDGIDAAPLWSRCEMVRLTNQGLARAFAERCLTIARAENLDGQPIEAYVKLAQRCKNNMRAMLGEIEAGCMAEGGAR